MKTIISVMSLLFLASSAHAEIVNIYNQVDAMRCKSYYGGEGPDYFFVQAGLTNPGDPSRKLEFVHTWQGPIRNYKAIYPITAFTYDTNARIYSIEMNTQKGIAKASFAQQGKGVFATPENTKPFPLNYCEIRGHW